MNAAIAGLVGALLAVFTVIGGVSAYQGDPAGVPQRDLYNYADN